MEENEYSNICMIPANYTDSGRLFGGMAETRNVVESVILLVVVGYPQLFWLPVKATVRIVIMTVTLIPLTIISIIGIDGDSLFQFAGHIVRYFYKRRKLHFRRVGYEYAPKQAKAEEEKAKAGICAGLSACKKYLSWCHRDKGWKILKNLRDRTH